MTTSSSTTIDTASGAVPVSIETRGQVTADDIQQLVDHLTAVSGHLPQPVRQLGVLLTVRHDRDAGAQARVRVEVESDDPPIEVEVYAGAMRNAIDEIRLRFDEICTD